MNYLEKKLKEKHISKQELATRLGVNKNTITNYCKKTNFDRISADRLFAIANILGISCDELVYEVLGQKRITKKVNTSEEQEAIEYIKAFQKDLYSASEKNLMAIYIDRVWNYIDKLQKENEFLKAPFEYGDGNTLHKRYVEINFISKDKIREKIKQLEISPFVLYGQTIDILKELLEEE